MLSQIKFLITETFKGINLFSAGSISSFTIASFFTFFLGVSSILYFSINDIIEENSNKNTIHVFVKHTHENTKDLLNLELELKQIPSIDSLQYISKQKALQNFSQDFEGDILNTISYNPLPSSFILYLKDTILPQQVLPALKKNPALDEIQSDHDYVVWLNRILFYGIAGSILIFALFYTFLLNINLNITKLNLIDQKRNLQNMLYCGIPYYFLMLPYLLRYLIIHTLGGFLGLGILTSFFYLINKYNLSLSTNYLTFLISCFIPLFVSGNIQLFSLRRMIKKVIITSS